MKTSTPARSTSEGRSEPARALEEALRRRGPMAIDDALQKLIARGIAELDALALINRGFQQRRWLRDPVDPRAIVAGGAGPRP
jgi:hypothetical protein